jgi:hypothetical protein
LKRGTHVRVITEYCDGLQTWFNLHSKSQGSLNGITRQREKGC